jgi:CDP-diacylglycerol--glycerol-3-phosphate 3-phosphatidyltransferase
MVLPFVLLIKNQENSWFLILAVVAMATDGLDGYIARKWNQTSELGMILDPLADKVNTAGVVIALHLYQGFPLWLASLIVGRDIFIVLGALLVFKKKKMITTSNKPGKIAVFFIATAVLVYVIDFPEIFNISLYIALFFILLSIASYLKNFIGMISGNKSSE